MAACREVELRVRPKPEEVSDVRRALERLRLPPSLLADATLLVTELVSNSIKHGGLDPEDHIRITVRWGGRQLQVIVRDRPPGLSPPPAVGSPRPRPDAEAGWGLFLVDRIASRWGILQDDQGGGYWFELESDPR